MKKELTFHHDEFKNVSEDAKNFIKKFLMKDPNQRIKLDDAVKDPFMMIKTDIKKTFVVNDNLANKITGYKKVNMFTKAIKMCMCKIYENCELDDLRNKFMEADENKNGILEKDEFQKLMDEFGFESNEIEMM